MKKEDKTLIIDRIAEELGKYSCFYLVETTGLNAEETSALRRECFKDGIKLMVVKNTLLHKALEKSGLPCSDIYTALHGSTSLMLANVGNAPAKLLKRVQKKDNPLPALKAAYVEETVY
ncbi:MAG: 50S ribosomal protein L10, partial [Muribaculaceae bacterium]|nr:50S ribosomal protein L10 [Muribaculaceae bacterium]